MTDDLARWEKWPIAALFVAQGLQVFEWYVSARIPPEVAAALPWLVTAAGLAAFVAIDGAMIATVMGMRAGRRGGWSVAAIVLTAAFGAAVALDLHGALAVGAWLHAGFALTIAAYLLHLAQPRVMARAEATVNDGLTPATEASTPTVQAVQVNLSQSFDTPARAAMTRPRDGFVYVMRADTGVYKIGRARNVEQRLSDIAGFVPFGVEVIRVLATADMPRLEARLHRCFADRRLNGEWFALTDTDVDALLSFDEVPLEQIDEAVECLSLVVNPPVATLPAPTDDTPEVVRLKDHDGLSFAQIGEQLGISRQAAWQRYRDAKKPAKEAA